MTYEAVKRPPITVSASLLCRYRRRRSGSNFIDILKLFENPQTETIVMIGGYRRRRSGCLHQRSRPPSRLSVYIAGVTAPKGKRMGHAGAIIAGGKGTADEKFAALEAAGVKPFVASRISAKR
ncbi:hypothetical protein DMH17_10485 [Raoultella planticola]|nr:hypothetical protein [Raoultella planticola]